MYGKGVMKIKFEGWVSLNNHMVFVVLVIVNFKLNSIDF